MDINQFNCAKLYTFFSCLLGSYSGTHDLSRGAQFYAIPSAVFDHSHLTLSLEYEVCPNGFKTHLQTTPSVVSGAKKEPLQFLLVVPASTDGVINIFTPTHSRINANHYIMTADCNIYDDPRSLYYVI